MTKCEKCEELLSILKDVKLLMDSENYVDSFDTIYDRISFAISNNNQVKNELEGLKTGNC